jgi:hypothetical protein
LHQAADFEALPDVTLILRLRSDDQRKIEAEHDDEHSGKRCDNKDVHGVPP